MQIKSLIVLPLVALGCQASVFSGRNKEEDTVTISSEVPIPTSTLYHTVTATVHDVKTVTNHVVETAAPMVQTYQLEEYEEPHRIANENMLLERVVIDILTADGNFTTNVPPHVKNSAAPIATSLFSFTIAIIVASAIVW